MNHDLIYDWNEAGDAPRRPAHRIEFDDETLRDGLQSPSVVTPTVDQRLEIVRLMDAMGVDTADIGLPGAGAAALADTLAIARATARVSAMTEAPAPGSPMSAVSMPIASMSRTISIFWSTVGVTALGD